MLLDTLFFRVAGVSFDNDDGSSRQTYISKLHEGDPIGFESFEYQGDPAFHIMTEDDRCIGNLPKEHIAFIMEHYEQGHYFEASVSEILGLDEDGKRIPGYHLGVEVAVYIYDEKPRFAASAPRPAPAPQGKQKKKTGRVMIVFGVLFAIGSIGSFQFGGLLIAALLLYFGFRRYKTFKSGQAPK